MASVATNESADERCLEKEDVVHQTHTTKSPSSNDYVDDKQARQKATEFLREAERNRRLIEKFEKEQALIVQCRKNGWTEVTSELEDFEKALERERKADKDNFKKQLSKVNNGVRKFQMQLVDVKPTPELIEKLKEIMSEVETSMNALKEEQRSRFEELLKEEKAYRQEITAYEKRIENWNSVKTDYKPPTSTTVKPKLQDRDLPPEVRALESFLNRTGGTCGGWDQYDHQAFLKVWTKFRGQPTYRAEAKLYLPSKTEEEIEQHENWYKELIHLQDRKREAIQKWKSRKQLELESRIQKEEEAERAKRREKEAKNQAQQHRAEEERKEAEQLLEQWKREKQMKEEEEEQQRLVEEIQKQRRDKEERRRQLEVKLIIEEHLRLKKEEEEEQRKRKEEEMREMEERRREATKGIKRFNERDLHKVEAKVHEKQLRRQEEEERQMRIASKLRDKIDGQVRRDPARLTRPTKGWEERMKNIGPSGGGPVLHMFHRAIPTWRQGL